MGFLPTSVTIGDLRVAAPTVPMTVVAGALEIPDDPAALGWWAGGALPGSTTGTVLVVGHVDTYDRGRGALFGLAQIQVGALVALTGPEGTASYRITGVREHPKTAVPADAFVGGGVARLALVTCGGAFDARTRLRGQRRRLRDARLTDLSHQTQPPPSPHRTQEDPCASAPSPPSTPP